MFGRQTPKHSFFSAFFTFKYSKCFGFGFGFGFGLKGVVFSCSIQIYEKILD